MDWSRWISRNTQRAAKRAHFSSPTMRQRNQFFNEAQFEAYRELGCYSVLSAGLPPWDEWNEALCFQSSSSPRAMPTAAAEVSLNILHGRRISRSDVQSVLLDTIPLWLLLAVVLYAPISLTRPTATGINETLLAVLPRGSFGIDVTLSERMLGSFGKTIGSCFHCS